MSKECERLMTTNATLPAVLNELISKGTDKNRKTYARHGMPLEHTYGVSIADLKLIAKTIKKQQALAAQLLTVPKLEAMYLGGMVANGALLSPAQLTDAANLAADAHLQMVSEYSIAWLAVEHNQAAELAREWIASPKDLVAASGWCTCSGLLATRPDDELDLPKIQAMLANIPGRIHTASNRARYTMNNFVIAAGTCVLPLAAQAQQVAKTIGPVSVDMGDTACEVRSALDHILKIQAMGKQGKKRKTIHC